jgi:hypothetical protein
VQRIGRCEVGVECVSAGVGAAAGDPWRVRAVAAAALRRSRR